MKLLVGLGNPGTGYHGTRHNIGFEVLDRVAPASTASEWRSQFRGLTRWARVGDQRVLCLKPLTFMNDAGSSVGAAANFHKISAPDILVIHDDLDLPFGVLRLKQGGGDGGHRGLRSLVDHLGPEFSRLRFGIGRPPPDFSGAITDYVLEAFASDEREVLEMSTARASGVVLSVVRDGLSAAMNTTNRRTE